MPIYIGASGPAATRLAGRIADGFITTSGKAPTLYSDTLLPALAEGAGKAGRTLDDLDLLIEMKVSFDPDRAKALADTKYWGALALTPEQKSGVEDPIEMQRLADALPVEQAASRWIVSTDPGRARREDQDLLDLGFRHLVFHAPGPDQERFLTPVRRAGAAPAAGPRAGLTAPRHEWPRGPTKTRPGHRHGRVRQDR